MPDRSRGHVLNASTSSAGPLQSLDITVFQVLDVAHNLMSGCGPHGKKAITDALDLTLDCELFARLSLTSLENTVEERSRENSI